MEVAVPNIAVNGDAGSRATESPYGRGSITGRSEDGTAKPRISCIVPTSDAKEAKPRSVEISPRFEKDEEVYIKTTAPMGETCLPYWYRGTITRVSEAFYENVDGTKTLSPCYKIRYKDSSAKYDEWLFADVLMSFANMACRTIAVEDNQRYKAASTPIYAPKDSSSKMRESVESAGDRVSVEKPSIGSRKASATRYGKRRLDFLEAEREEPDHNYTRKQPRSTLRDETPEKTLRKPSRAATTEEVTPEKVLRKTPRYATEDEITQEQTVKKSPRITSVNDSTPDKAIKKPARSMPEDKVPPETAVKNTALSVAIEEATPEKSVRRPSKSVTEGEFATDKAIKKPPALFTTDEPKPAKTVKEPVRTAAVAGATPDKTASPHPVMEGESAAEKTGRMQPPQPAATTEITAEDTLSAKEPKRVSLENGAKSSEKATLVERSKAAPATAAAKSVDRNESSDSGRARKKAKTTKEEQKAPGEAKQASVESVEKPAERSENKTTPEEAKHAPAETIEKLAEHTDTKEPSHEPQKTVPAEEPVIPPLQAENSAASALENPVRPSDQAPAGSPSETTEDESALRTRISDILNDLQSTAAITLPVISIPEASTERSDPAPAIAPVASSSSGDWSAATFTSLMRLKLAKDEELRKLELKDKEAERNLVHKFLELQSQREERDRQERGEQREFERTERALDRQMYREDMVRILDALVNRNPANGLNSA